MIIAGGTAAVGQVKQTRPSSFNHPVLKEIKKPDSHRCSSKTSEGFGTTFYGSRLKKKRKGGGDGISTSRSTEELGNSCCCLCNAVAGFVTNTCLPAIGITSCRSKKHKLNDPYSQNILKNLNQQFNKMYGHFHIRLLPAFRPLVTELCFPGYQMEADGLTIVAAQIWMATYLIKLEKNNLNLAEKEKVVENYVELIWEIEDAFKIDEQFYSLHQKLKKRLLPRVWKLEEKYSGERRNFVDVEYREDLSVERPFDDLYLRDKLKLKKNIKLKYTTKTLGASSSMELVKDKDKEIDFTGLNSNQRLKIILTLLQMSIKSVMMVGKGLEKNRKLLLNETECTHTLDMVEGLLKIVKKEVLVTTSKESELTDWVCCIVDDTNNYVTCSQWVCDRIAEIRGMSQLCYEHLALRNKTYQFDLPDYHTLAAEAMDVQNRHQMGLDKCDVTRKSTSWKDYLVDLKKENDDHLDTRVDEKDPFLVANNNDFLSSEYPHLLTRLPICVHLDDQILTLKFF